MTLAPYPYLGAETGEKEWTSNNAPDQVFMHTRSYEQFKDHNSLFLLGRRGTGKTSTLCMLQYQIRRGELSEYSCSFTLSSDETFAILVQELRAHDDRVGHDQLEFAQKTWRWVIESAAMCALVWQVRRHGFENGVSESAYYRCVEKEVFARGWLSLDSVGRIHTERSPVESFIQALRGCTATAPLGETVDKLWDQQFVGARNAYRRLALKGRPAAVILDSLEYYDFEDRPTQVVTSGLVKAALHFYNHAEANIQVKIAFPSDVFPTLPGVNQGKIGPRCMFIHWSFGDLVSLVAKRYARMEMERDPAQFKELERADAARQYLYRFLPATITLDAGVQFDTLAYAVRHTQKVPRQIVILFNCVLTQARWKETRPKPIAASTFKEGSRARLDILVRSVLDALEYRYNGASDMIRDALSGQRNCLTYRRLRMLLRATKSFQTIHGLDGRDVVRILTGAGIVGRAVEVEASFRGIRVLKAQFQYQVPDSLTLNERSLCIIHPMFYRPLGIRSKDSHFIYPMPSQEEETVLRAVLALNGTAAPPAIHPVKPEA